MKKLMILFYVIMNIMLLFGNAQVINQDSNHVDFVVKIDSIKVIENAQYSTINDQSYMLRNTQIGSPDIPFLIYYIAVPEDGRIQVSVQSLNQESFRLVNDIQPIPFETYEESQYLRDYKIDKNLYAHYSTLFFEVEKKIKFREYYVIPLKIYPIQYSYQDKRIELHKQLMVKVQIDGSTQTKTSSLSNWDSMYSSMILNWESGQFFAGQPDRSIINFSNFNLSDQWYSFEVSQDGIYALSASQLSGLPLNDIDPSSIRLFSTGGASYSAQINNPGLTFEEIPIMIEDGNDGMINGNDKIIFYAQDRDGFGMNTEYSINRNTKGDFYYYNPYSGANKYWLTWGGDFSGNPKRINVSSSPQSSDISLSSSLFSLHVESEKVRISDDQETYYAWYSQKCEGTSNASYQQSFTISDIESSKPAVFKSYIKSEKSMSSARRVDHFINDQLLRSDVWASSELRIFENATTSLQEGLNVYRFDIYRNLLDNLFLDFFDVNYYKKHIKRSTAYMIDSDQQYAGQIVKYQFSNKPSDNILVFKVDHFNEVTVMNPDFQSSTFSFNVQSQEGSRLIVAESSDYLTVSNLKKEIIVDLTSDQSSSDFVIISPKFFSSAAEDLKQFYLSKYQVNARIAYQEDIFNQFSGGNVDPVAIRNYLKYAFENYNEPKIKGATIIGLGTQDWRNYSGLANNKNRAILFFNNYSSPNENSTITSSDHFYTYFNQISRPEIVIGRIPVSTVNEWTTYFNKMQSYNDNMTGKWRNNILFLADDYYHYGGTDDTEHTVYTNQIVGLIHPAVRKDPVYAQEYPINEFMKKPFVNELYISKMNQGALFSIYMGHGNPQYLGNEYYLGIDDMARFSNINRQTVFFAGSCSVGRFDSPYYRSLSESMVLNPNGGAIASIAAIRVSYGNPNSTLIKEIMRESVNNRKTIGESFMLASQRVTGTNTAVYQLLGDPLAPAYPPERISTISIENDSTSQKDKIAYQSRQKIDVTGTFNQASFNGEVDFNVYDTQYTVEVSSPTRVSVVDKDGRTIFNGKASLTNGSFNASFIVPDDIMGGNKAKIISSYSDINNQKEYVNYLSNITFSGHDFYADNPDIPTIDIYLENKKFKNGDEVSNKPLLIVDLYDSNGINILGTPGHHIMMLLDNSTNPIAITESFAYDLNSYTKGSAYYQFSQLSEGMHSLKIIAFDNFNQPAVKQIEFNVSKSEGIELNNVLIYPNPIKKDAYFTFMLTQEAMVSVQVYTVTGRKIKDIPAVFCTKGYNQIYWDTKDNDGDKIANNTYFYKVKAKQINGSKTAEKIEKLIILK